MDVVYSPLMTFKVGRLSENLLQLSERSRVAGVDNLSEDWLGNFCFLDLWFVQETLGVKWTTKKAWPTYCHTYILKFLHKIINNWNQHLPTIEVSVFRFVFFWIGEAQLSHLREGYGKTLKVLGGSRGEASPTAVLEPVAPEAGDDWEWNMRYDKMMKLSVLVDEIFWFIMKRCLWCLVYPLPEWQYFAYCGQSWSFNER